MNYLTRRNFLKACSTALVVLPVAPFVVIRRQIAEGKPTKGFDPTQHYSNIRLESGQGVIIAARGTTVTFSRPFKSTSSFSLHLVSEQNWAVVTNNTRAGFTVKVYDMAGTAVGGIIDWCGIEPRDTGKTGQRCFS